MSAADGIPPWGGRRAQQARALIAATLPAPCIRCGRDVLPWQDWDTGHRLDRDTYPELTWDPTNWGPEHRGENRKAGAAHANRKRRRTLEAIAPNLMVQVSGPPCSGKSTWIAQHAQHGDTVMDDIDLANANGGRDQIPHEAWRDWYARNDQTISTWRGPGTLWFTRGNPRPLAHGITVHMVMADEATCHQRAAADSRPEVTHEWIAQWFARYSSVTQSQAREWTAPGW